MPTTLTQTPTLNRDAARMRENVGEASAFLKRMQHPDRLLICCALMGQELSVRQIEDMLDLRQPALSQQLADLREAGLIAGRKEGKQMFYRLNDARVESFIHGMHALFCKADHD